MEVRGGDAIHAIKLALFNIKEQKPSVLETATLFSHFMNHARDSSQHRECSLSVTKSLQRDGLYTPTWSLGSQDVSPPPKKTQTKHLVSRARVHDRNTQHTKAQPLGDPILTGGSSDGNRQNYRRSRKHERTGVCSATLPLTDGLAGVLVLKQRPNKQNLSHLHEEHHDRPDQNPGGVNCQGHGLHAVQRRRSREGVLRTRYMVQRGD